MTLKSLAQHLITLSILCSPSFSYADDAVLLKYPFTIETDQETVTNIKEDPSPLTQKALSFTFDWEQYASLASNMPKVAEQEQLLKTVTNLSNISNADQAAIGVLLYRLGTYYTHVTHTPDLAIARLTIANALLADANSRAWTFNHIAYAYEQKFAASNNPLYYNYAQYYLSKVAAEFPRHTKNTAIAFASSINGYLQIDAKNYKAAEATLKKTLALYDAIPNSKGDQYMRAKEQLANALLGQENNTKAAITILKQTKRYWSAQGRLRQDPYAASNLTSLARAYLQSGDAKAAHDTLETAITIYRNVYGAKSPQLAQPYKLIAQAFKDLGDSDQGSIYDQKADEMRDA